MMSYAMNIPYPRWFLPTPIAPSLSTAHRRRDELGESPLRRSRAKSWCAQARPSLTGLTGRLGRRVLRDEAGSVVKDGCNPRMILFFFVLFFFSIWFWVRFLGIKHEISGLHGISTMKYRDEPWNIGILWDYTGDHGDNLLSINGGFHPGGSPHSWMLQWKSSWK